MVKITLKQDGTIEAGGASVGTWHYVDVWAENGGRRDKSGNLTVRGYWTANLKNNDGLLIEYKRKDLAELIRKYI